MLNRLTLGIATAALVAAGSALAQTQQQGGGSAAGRMMQQGGGQGMPMMQGEGRPGMMQGRGMMMGDRMGRGGMGPHMMLMMMALIDTDGSETLSLEEVQAVHARMFSYADADDDGELTLEELRAFMHGEGGPSMQ